MILSDREIWMEIGSGRLKFTPDIEPEQVVPSAVDLRLSNQFTSFKPAVAGVETIIDITQSTNVEEILNVYGETQTLSPNETFLLKPLALVLGYTLEFIEMPNYLAARVEGRSSLARLGISIHQTAPTVHATFVGQLRLEISHNGPHAIRLHPGQTICQLVIERLGSPSQSTLKGPFQQQRQSPN
jgi:dCTP deaminase